MRFKLDENLPVELLDDLRLAGHDADTVLDEGLSGQPDHVVIAAAKASGRVVLTMDRGIGDIRVYEPSQHAGIVLFRLRRAGRGYVLAFIRGQIENIVSLNPVGHLVIVSEGRVRWR